jgi:uncharacterized membrane protein
MSDPHPSRNPFAPPAAKVDDPIQAMASSAGEVFMPEGRKRPAGQGWQWFVQAWQLFKQQPLRWWGAILLMFVLLIVASVVPLLNLLTMLAFPFMMAGLGACARSVQQSGRFDIGQVFDGFRKQPKTLALSGLLGLGLTLGGMALLMLIFGGGMSFLSLYTGDMASRQAASMQIFGGLGMGFLLGYMLLLSVLASALMFAPFLIHEQGMGVVQALRASMKGSFKNVLPGLVGMLVYAVLAVVATIPIMLGWLVLMPVIFIAVYTSYRDIFTTKA